MGVGSRGGEGGLLPSYPWAAAAWYHLDANWKSFGTPSPRSYSMPKQPRGGGQCRLGHCATPRRLRCQNAEASAGASAHGAVRCGCPAVHAETHAVMPSAHPMRVGPTRKRGTRCPCPAQCKRLQCVPPGLTCVPSVYWAPGLPASAARWYLPTDGVSQRLRRQAEGPPRDSMPKGRTMPPQGNANMPTRAVGSVIGPCYCLLHVFVDAVSPLIKRAYIM